MVAAKELAVNLLYSYRLLLTHDSKLWDDSWIADGAKMQPVTLMLSTSAILEEWARVTLLHSVTVVGKAQTFPVSSP